jgi:hypothetical protein
MMFSSDKNQIRKKKMMMMRVAGKMKTTMKLKVMNGYSE